jgi:RoxA-like, cytochrome c-like/Cytochrome c
MSGRLMMKKFVGVIASVLPLGLAGCWSHDPVEPPVVPPTPPSAQDRNAQPGVADPFGETVLRIVYLDQGWSPSDSQRFYFTPQGSEILPYSWFLALEQPESTALFRDNVNMTKFRYLTQKPDAMNPEGLPVGFVKDTGRDRDWLGITCAACHTAQIDYQGVGYRIDGGPALADVEGFLVGLASALKATRDQGEKLGRFAAKALGGTPTAAQLDALKEQMAIVIDRREGYNARNFPAEQPAGYGRVDALGAILNEVFFRVLRPEERTPNTANSHPATAPVSYPCLWDTPQHDKVQWIGAAQNGGFMNTGNLGRNVGEVLGVFGDFEIPDSRLDVRYRSTVKVSNLHTIDGWLVTLWSPQWPAGFPQLEPAKVAAGKTLYEANCVSCHEVIDRKSPERKIIAKMKSPGTDPLTADNFWNRKSRSGLLEGRFLRVYPSFAGLFGPEATGESALINSVIGTIAGSPFQAPEDELTKIELGVRSRPRPDTFVLGPQYKARPLNGIWATAPYLHNGSVPNLYQLLLPSSKRVSSFRVGSRKFDPKNVGFETNDKRFFEFRARNPGGLPRPGNSNEGHEYGTDLADKERWELVEYLKSL